jgi:hypothetical protein
VAVGAWARTPRLLARPEAAEAAEVNAPCIAADRRALVRLDKATTAALVARLRAVVAVARARSVTLAVHLVELVASV